jgi:hypothetical protein
MENKSGATITTMRGGKSILLKETGSYGRGVCLDLVFELNWLIARRARAFSWERF